ncbi:hypothetical protein LOZ65_006662 [Ophidiomyces ophidiicola]|nr:hypothetical protein LOZ65_006662 [Ophidiomyces ophidiicola]
MTTPPDPEAAATSTEKSPPAGDDPRSSSSAAAEAALVRKCDVRVVPILFVLFMLSFIDRINIGNARLQGLERDLGMQHRDYNVALFVFFIPYILLEVPSNLVLKRVAPSTWLSGIIAAWGVVTICQGVTTSFAGLVVCRFFLGVFEAGFVPGCVYLISMYYQRYELQKRLNFFFCASIIAGAVSGLLASGSLQVPDRRLAGDGDVPERRRAAAAGGAAAGGRVRGAHGPAGRGGGAAVRARREDLPGGGDVLRAGQHGLRDVVLHADDPAAAGVDGGAGAGDEHPGVRGVDGGDAGVRGGVGPAAAAVRVRGGRVRGGDGGLRGAAERGARAGRGALRGGVPGDGGRVRGAAGGAGVAEQQHGRPLQARGGHGGADRRGQRGRAGGQQRVCGQ